MKDPLDRTKVVLRHLPHTISQSALMDQIDVRFSGRYKWFWFRSGKQSLKSPSYSTAYIDFKRPDDVIEFAEFFDGHVFVNEKGTQFKTIVEYAPSQRVPKQMSKKDGREGTIGKDPEYLEFLEFVSKPVENLPSAEIQLERKEAERAGAAKEAPIVTPLMDFVRQKRAAKGGPRRSLPNGKLMRRAGASSSSSSTVAKRGSEKRTSSTMYVLRNSGKSTNGKEKSTYAKRDDRQVSDKPGSVILEEERGASGAPDTGKKKILLLKGKEKEIQVVTSLTPQQNSSTIKPAARTNQRHEEKDRKPPRGPLLKDSDGLPDDKHGCMNNKDKPDRGVWTPLRCSDGSQSAKVLPDSAEGTREEAKYDVSNERGVELKTTGAGRGGHFSSENGTHKHSGRRALTHNAKDADGSSNSNEGKPLKRGVSAGYGSHEKRVWVQKPSSGS
ncbi:putative nonsense-mediated mRNA decay protein [Helianthus annuus]|nr:putative nonsense-mediated mRNA decay protein [Helianthus annuus]KAJ0600195.1 putative nonsense-mediated mRNA decay protein [Helianthus annuus]KAJ0607591.1 putative nonsense-mediated mRNA decay protein [Helianthus annuus]KAJ0767653.1 putative nonsense-mediated mRNA decay protein [Helianthus annuus]KAJ0773480.1 putative nonsense-mediated mRNA decay protein [Helianthus annuus]